MANTTITNTASETQNELNQETQTAKASIIVNPIKTTIKGNNLQIHYKNGTRYEITLTNYKGEPINKT